jgi:hypothetical protein
MDTSRQMRMEQEPHIKTFGEVFPKFMIELVADDEPNGSFNLLLWNGAEAFVQSSVRLVPGPGSDSKPRIFEPPDIDSTIRRAMRFPTYGTPYGSCRGLFNEICALIKKFTDLSPKLASLAAYSVFASWFSDFTPVPVCVSIVGPHSYQRASLFRLLSCMYRRPLLLGETSAAAICSLPMGLCPALFFERFEFSLQLEKLLRASSAPDIYIPWKGRLVNTCCAKVICADEPLDSEKLRQGAIEIPVAPTRQPLPILEKCVQQDIANEYQSKLLSFRLANYNRVRNSNFDVPCFEFSARDLARCLGACVSEDLELQKQIIPLLIERNNELQAVGECTRYLNNILIEIMLSFCHREGKRTLRVGEITSGVNSILKERGEMLEMTPKQVGKKLSAMGLAPYRLDALGRGIQLLDPIRQRIHRLAWDYRSDSVSHDREDYSAKCRHCREKPTGKSEPNPTRLIA